MSITATDWLGVEPRHLATLAAVADAGSFRAAAARLGYVQSAVSQQIAHLERVLGTRLIIRGQGNRDLTFTPAGRTLLAHARRIVDQVRAAYADVAYIAEETPVRLAVEAAVSGLIPRLAVEFGLPAGVRPDLTVREVPTAQQLALIACGEVDVAIGAHADVPPGISRRILREDEWVLVCPPTDPLAGTTHLTSLAALRGATLILDRSQPLPVRASDLGAARTVHCDRLAHAVDLVRSGAGIALLPAVSVPTDDPRLRTVDLHDLLPARVYSAVWLAGRRLPATLDRLAQPAMDTTPLRVAA